MQTVSAVTCAREEDYCVANTKDKRKEEKVSVDVLTFR
jgi:hypothetical protein